MSQQSLSSAQAMALSQLYTNEITQPQLLEALASTPRAPFVPKHLAGAAYVDEELYLGEGRYLLSPLDGARLLAAAEILPTDRVLDVACGMGFSSVVAAKIAREVVAIDTSAMFIQYTLENAAQMAVPNLKAHVVDALPKGYAPSAPYDVIIVNGAVEAGLHDLIQQVNEGGRLVFVQEKSPARPGTCGLGVLTVLTRQGMQLNKKEITECFVPAIDAFKQPPAFKFG
jgi:protein-L-isoaspartate(D-aspartate) O-methyltransferase